MQIKRMKGYGQCFVCSLLSYRNRNPYRQKAVHKCVHLLSAFKSLTMRSFLKSAFSRLYLIEKEMTQLFEKAARGHTECLDLAARYQEQLESMTFIPSKLKLSKWRMV